MSYAGYTRLVLPPDESLPLSMQNFNIATHKECQCCRMHTNAQRGYRTKRAPHPLPYFQGKIVAFAKVIGIIHVAYEDLYSYFLTS